MTETLLELQNVTRRFGGLTAVSEVTLKIPRGIVLGLIGPNGAGKTTIVNLISGALPPSRGQMFFKGERIDGQPPHRVSRLGIARTFQIVQPFPEMTALENVQAAALFAGNQRNLNDANKVATAQLDRVGLGGLGATRSSLLSLGQRKRLELAKSLAMNPSLLLLDEVNSGLHGAELSTAIDLIRDLAKSGLTIIIIEHLMRVVTSLCDEIAVLHHGQLIARDKPDKIVEDTTVIEAYLGERYSRQRAAQTKNA